MVVLINDNNIDIIENIELLENLTGFAVEGRYAIIHDDIDDVYKYIKLLEILKVSIEKS